MKELLLIIICAGLVSFVHAQKQVTGSVTDAKDSTQLAGVSVKLKGSTKGTVTDVNGEFKLEVRSTSDTLVANICGYNSEEIRVSQLTTLNNSITLQPNIGYLTGRVGGLTVRRPFYARAWYTLKYTVRSIFH